MGIMNAAPAHRVVALGAPATVEPQTHSTDLAGQIDAIGRAFEEFKAKHESQLAEISARGAADPVLTEQVERINGQITADLDRLRKAQGEQAAQVAALIAGGGQAAEGRADLRNDTRLFLAAAAGGKGKPIVEVSDDQVANYRQYCQHFGAFLRRGGMNGDLLGESIRAEMSVGQDSAGGFLVPTQMETAMRTRLFETSPMRQHAGSMTITTDKVELPIDADDATSGGWVSEKESRGETATPTLRMQTIEVHEQEAEPHVTQRLLDDSAIDVEGWLQRKVEDKMGRVENTAFVTGTGVGQPKGFLAYGSAATTAVDNARSWGVLQYVPAGADGAFPTPSGATWQNADALIGAIAELNPAYRAGATWAMNRRTEAEVRKLKDADGRYVVGFGDLRDGAFGFSIHNFPVANFEDMPNIGSGTFSIAFGNFQVGYLIVDRQGFRMMRDPYTRKPFVKFYTTRRVGGDVVNFDAIKLVKFSAS